MEIRRIRPDEHAAAGDVCVAAYDPLLTGAEDDYAERLGRGRPNGTPVLDSMFTFVWTVLS